jgi:hypothetical protein
MSVWVAAPLSWALGGSLEDRLLLWPALSGAAILLERVTEGRTATQAATYYEEQEHDDVMLRKQETGGPGRDPVFHEE